MVTRWTEYRTPAHPRSRGENFLNVILAAVVAGSSPLTRGKRQLTNQDTDAGGLIPAHAGKTAPCLPRA